MIGRYYAVYPNTWSIVRSALSGNDKQTFFCQILSRSKLPSLHSLLHASTVWRRVFAPGINGHIDAILRTKGGSESLLDIPMT